MQLGATGGLQVKVWYDLIFVLERFPLAEWEGGDETESQRIRRMLLP